MATNMEIKANGYVELLRFDPVTGVPSRRAVAPHDQASIDAFTQDLTPQQQVLIDAAWASIQLPVPDTRVGPTPEEDMDMALRTCPACAALIEALLAPINDPDGIKPGQTLTHTELVRRLVAKRP